MAYIKLAKRDFNVVNWEQFYGRVHLVFLSTLKQQTHQSFDKLTCNGTLVETQAQTQAQTHTAAKFNIRCMGAVPPIKLHPTPTQLSKGKLNYVTGPYLPSSRRSDISNKDVGKQSFSDAGGNPNSTQTPRGFNRLM
jgi:hypothetical protein